MKTEKISTLLARAKHVIQDPDHWCQGWFAKDKSGRRTSVLYDNAYAFCSVGAIDKIGGERAELIKYLNLAAPNRNIAYFNDSHSHAEVIAVWNTAIKLARADEAKK